MLSVQKLTQSRYERVGGKFALGGTTWHASVLLWLSVLSSTLMAVVLVRQPTEAHNNSGTIPCQAVYTVGFENETVLLIQLRLAQL